MSADGCYRNISFAALIFEMPDFINIDHLDFRQAYLTLISLPISLYKTPPALYSLSKSPTPCARLFDMHES